MHAKTATLPRPKIGRGAQRRGQFLRAACAALFACRFGVSSASCSTKSFNKVPLYRSIAIMPVITITMIIKRMQLSTIILLITIIMAWIVLYSAPQRQRQHQRRRGPWGPCLTASFLCLVKLAKHVQKLRVKRTRRRVLLLKRPRRGGRPRKNIYTMLRA